jgi:hypothetical protein
VAARLSTVKARRPNARVVRTLLAAATLAACRTVAPAPAPAATAMAAPIAEVPPLAAAPPGDWKTDGALTQDEGDARCRKELPACAHAFGMYWLPPSPCANKGTRCMEMPDLSQGRWSCGCDLCAGSSDCKPTEHCGSDAPPCSNERRPLRCIAGPLPRCLDTSPRLPPP